jgi:hypothetical protein
MTMKLGFGLLSGLLLGSLIAAAALHFDLVRSHHQKARYVAFPQLGFFLSVPKDAESVTFEFVGDACTVRLPLDQVQPHLEKQDRPRSVAPRDEAI